MAWARRSITCSPDHAPCEAEQRRRDLPEGPGGRTSRVPGRSTRRIAPALEAICLKALALKPVDRYETAEALKDDLEHWLADEPVTAWREPISVRRPALDAATSDAGDGRGGHCPGWSSGPGHRLRARLDAEQPPHQEQRTAPPGKGGFGPQAGPDPPLDRGLLHRRQRGGPPESEAIRRPSSAVAGKTARVLPAIDAGAGVVAGRTRAVHARQGLVRAGEDHGSAGQPFEAKQHNAAAVGLYRRLLESHPDSPHYAEGLAKAYSNLGSTQSKMGDIRGAADSFGESIAILRAAHGGAARRPGFTGWPGHDL